MAGRWRDWFIRREQLRVCGGVSSLVMWEARLEDRYEHCLSHKYDIPLAKKPGYGSYGHHSRGCQGRACKGR
jgi:hypothetical protein